ncbi:MAG: hypothetical protein AAF458_01495 [Pseudomonadota bacterium]
MSAARIDLGFEYPTYTVCIDRETQAEKLDCCGIDPATFGDHVDVTHLAMETILAGRRGGASINGSVHVSQVFDLRDPIRLGEELELSGAVTGAEPAARGKMVTCSFQLKRPDGSVPLVLERSSLQADPDRMDGTPRARSKPQELPALTLLSTHQLEPEKVARYSNEAENLIHSEPEVARQFGFKAPIAGGLMAVRYMLAELHSKGVVNELRMSVRFRRPMFWDDELKLNETAGSPRQFVMLRSSDGKMVNDATIDHVGYQ